MEREKKIMDYFDEDEDDEWMMDIPLPASSRCEKRVHDEDDHDDDEMRGGGLFPFHIRLGEIPRRWKNVVHQTHHSAQLHQTRDVRDGDRLGEEMVEAVRRTLVSIVENHPNLCGDDRIHFTMQSNAFAQQTNHCFQSTQFRVLEVNDGEDETQRFDAYMQQLARQLNSSQSFSPGDAFTLDVTTIRMPEEGGKPKKYDVVKAKVRGIMKQSHIVVKNEDNLCCARAVVTMRAWADKQAGQFPISPYASLRRGLPCQKTQALELVQQAGLSPSEPCGLPHVKKIQEVWTPTYQIKVMKIGRPHMIVFARPPAPRRILLVLEDGHFDGSTSFTSMFNNTYFCHDCDRGFDHDDIEHHPCDEGVVPVTPRPVNDLLAAKERLGEGVFPKPTIPCNLCHRHFMGQQCLAQHAIGPGKSPCDRIKKCPECCKVSRVEFNRNGGRKGPPHKCGYGQCEFCEKRVDLYQHQCYIQKVAKKDDDPKKKSVPSTEWEIEHPSVLQKMAW